MRGYLQIIKHLFLAQLFANTWQNLVILLHKVSMER